MMVDDKEIPSHDEPDSTSAKDTASTSGFCLSIKSMLETWGKLIEMVEHPMEKAWLAIFEANDFSLPDGDVLILPVGGLQEMGVTKDMIPPRWEKQIFESEYVEKGYFMKPAIPRLFAERN